MATESDTEKITINLVPVDLGKIDLLVEQGLYATRSDLIRTGIRRVLEENDTVLHEVISRRLFNIGLIYYTEKSLLAKKDRGERLRIRSVGRLVLHADVSPDTADAVIEEIIVKGSLKMSPEVRARLGDRIKA